MEVSRTTCGINEEEIDNRVKRELLCQAGRQSRTLSLGGFSNRTPEKWPSIIEQATRDRSSLEAVLMRKFLTRIRLGEVRKG